MAQTEKIEAMRPRITVKRTLLSLLILSVYFGSSLLVVNQRIGWDEAAGPNLLAVLLRSDIWFAFAALLTTLFWRQLRLKGRAKRILWNFPLIFLGFTLLSSALNGVLHGVVADYFDLGDLFVCITATLVGLVVYQIACSSSKFAGHLYLLLMWAASRQYSCIIRCGRIRHKYYPRFRHAFRRWTRRNGYCWAWWSLPRFGE